MSDITFLAAWKLNAFVSHTVAEKRPSAGGFLYVRAVVSILLTALPFMSNSESSCKQQTGQVSLSRLHMESNKTTFDILSL